MNILLLAATPPEIAPTVNWLRGLATDQQRNTLIFPRCSITVLFTGLGTMGTAYQLGEHFAGADKPNLAIQGGVAGAMDRSLKLTEVVNVTSDRLIDLGAETAEGSWLSPTDMGFPPGPPFDERGVLSVGGPGAILPYSTVAGGTVNRTTGTQRTLDLLQVHFPDVQVETMEGAAFFYACRMAEVDALQLRGISNYVGVRDRSAWKMTEAIGAINQALQRVLQPFITAAPST